ncbi:aromatase/cyclase [Streptomyces yangpuensis]|uniref:Aromatase/cyclase n=1 Tax=Streptomyces yangpuensis TaxID=1648182 RepID=A0ABY5Q7Q5_9ACTN|nr:aromatase/cyclase [Streptomyces yangpuensis]UUY52471.1 aromatase/cyclase [Streptomyces yangpuensis]
MPVERVHRTSYVVDVAAPGGVVYGLLADTTQWPLFVPASIHVERLDFDGRQDRFHMWVTANGSVRSWLSRRTLDAGRMRIDFRQEVPAPPATSMGGTWTVESLGPERCRLTLEHDFTVAGNRAADAAWLERATDTNSRAELDQLKATAERWHRLDGLLLSFEDSVRVDGPAEVVYGFLYDVAAWPERVPHVGRLDVAEDEPGVQTVSMDTVTPDGTVHTTESVRVCFPHAGRIVYKQTTPPALLSAHAGEWSVTPDATGVTVVSHHRVLLREEAVPQVLGPDADLEQARTYVRQALGRNSRATLELARRRAESAVRTL